MFAYIRGKPTRCSGGEVWLEAHGVGYRISVPERIARVLGGRADASRPENELSVSSSQEDVLLFVQMRTHDDIARLYGFAEEIESEWFLILQTVQGLGPRLALAVLDHFEVHDLVRALLHEDSEALLNVSGVGKRTAGQMLVLLEPHAKRFAERMAQANGPQQAGEIAYDLTGNATGLSKARQPLQANQASVLQALVQLGWTQSLAEEAVQATRAGVLDGNRSDEPGSEATGGQGGALTPENVTDSGGHVSEDLTAAWLHQALRWLAVPQAGKA